MTVIGAKWTRPLLTQNGHRRTNASDPKTDICATPTSSQAICGKTSESQPGASIITS
jgi:hypothetical protein